MFVTSEFPFDDMSFMPYLCSQFSPVNIQMGKLQHKVFLRIHHLKGLQNNILRIEENLDGRTSIFSAKSKMAAKNKMLSIIQ